MGGLSIFVFLSGLLLAVLSAASITQFKPSLIVSVSDDFAEYPSLETTPIKTSFCRVSLEGVSQTKNSLEVLPSDIFLTIMQFFDYRLAGNLCQTSKTLHRKVNSALDMIINQMKIMKVERVGISRKDHFIVFLHFIPLFKESFPGLINHTISIIDFICCALVAFLISSETREDKVTNSVIEPTCTRYAELRDKFSRLDFFRRFISVYPLTLLPDIFRAPSYVNTFFFRVFNFAAVPYALEIISFINQHSKLIIGNSFYQKAVTLFPLGASMSYLDQRFLDNLIKFATAQELVNVQIGCYHLLHDLIIKGGSYNSEIFKRKECVSVKIDCQTNLSFYSAALFYGLKHGNIPVIRGLLNDFPNNEFFDFSANELDKLRNISDLNDLITKLGGNSAKIINFLSS